MLERRVEIDPLANTSSTDSDGDSSDSDSDYGSAGDATVSLLSAATDYTYENGRRYHGYREGKYGRAPHGNQMPVSRLTIRACTDTCCPTMTRSKVSRGCVVTTVVVVAAVVVGATGGRSLADTPVERMVHGWCSMMALEEPYDLHKN